MWGGGGGGGGGDWLPRHSQKCHDSTLQVPLQFPLQLRWRCGPDMPLGITGYVQSVVVQGKVYVGGGHTDRRNGDIVMVYDISSLKWAELPPYRAQGFAMTVINNQLVLVGGQENDYSSSKVLGVWTAESNEWAHPYPHMSTARSSCSAVVYKEWLVVAGGDVNGAVSLSSLEVMNTVTLQWYAAPPTPTPWAEMKTAIVEDTCYFMGGFTGFTTVVYSVYSVSLPALISQLHSQGSEKIARQHQIWKEIPELLTTFSTPLSISGSLLAVGGMDKDRQAVTAIHLYQPDTGTWVKVGDMPTPRYQCTCAMIADREMLVAGGRENIDYLCRSDIAIINAP